MPNITIYMAISLDGFIAGTNNETPWSDDEWENYKRFLSKNDCLIIGRKTFELMQKANEFETLGNPNIIVIGNIDTDSALVAQSPEEALDIAQKNNWNNIVIGGGQILNSYFLKNKLANALHLDIEPVLLFKGTKLFEEENAIQKLFFINSRTLPSGTISVDYNIKETHA